MTTCESAPLPASERRAADNMQEHSALVAYCLLGLMKHAEAVECARRLGPEIWPEGFPRDFAASIVTGEPYVAPPDHDQYAEAVAWVRELELWGHGGPDTPEWACHLLRCLASERAAPVVADTLAWAARMVRRGVHPLSVRDEVERAFGLVDIREVAA